jgi:uncharacterized protein (TIGR00251 family)
MSELAGLATELAAAGRLILDVKVIPRSRRSELAGRMADGTWKIRVAAAPEHGRANDELCAFLARELGVTRDQVTISAGHASPRKRVRITL